MSFLLTTSRKCYENEHLMFQKWYNERNAHHHKWEVFVFLAYFSNVSKLSQKIYTKVLVLSETVNLKQNSDTGLHLKFGTATSSRRVASSLKVQALVVLVRIQFKILKFLAFRVCETNVSPLYNCIFNITNN